MGDMFKTFGDSSKLKKVIKSKNSHLWKGIKYTLQKDF